jgi:hypothetical protein
LGFIFVGSLAKLFSAALIGFEHDRVISHPGYVTADLAIAKFIAPLANWKGHSNLLFNPLSSG